MNIEIERSGLVHTLDVASFSTSSTYPYSIPVCDIACAEQPHINIGDNVHVYSGGIDLFSGTISNMSTSGGNMNIGAVGHLSELSYKYVTTQINGAGQTSGDVIGHILDTYCDGLNSAAMTGNELVGLYVSANRRTVLDIFDTIQTIDPVHRLIADVTYKRGVHDRTYVSWIPLDNKARVCINEGASNVLNVSASVDSSNLSNSVKIFGTVVEDGTGNTTQYVATSSDMISQNKYGVREYIYTDTSLNSAELCQGVADGIINLYANPIISGTITVTGMHISPGDMVDINTNVRINGENVIGKYRVRNVTHHYAPWSTSITFGDTVPVYSVIESMVNKFRINNLNSVV